MSTWVVAPPADSQALKFSFGNQRHAGMAFWLPASGLALLTGAMGCSCVGYAGVVGLALGHAMGLAPGALRRIFRPTPRS